MSVSWLFNVHFKPANIRPDSDGILEYWPATRSALLTDANGIELENAKGSVNAGGLVPGGQISLLQHIVNIVSTRNSNEPLNLSTDKLITTTDESLNCKQEFKRATMYTKDKAKKNKKWHDGWLKYGNGLATFYCSEDKMIHRKKIKNISEIAEGTLHDTAGYVIEVTGDFVEKPKEELIEDDKENEVVKLVDVMIGEGEYEMMYTTDKIRKAKRWKDGKLRISSNSNAVFLDEEGHQIYKKKVKAEELVDGFEMSTGQYIFQVGSFTGLSVVKDKNEMQSVEKIAPVVTRSAPVKAKTTFNNKPVSVNKKPVVGRSNKDVLNLFSKQKPNV